MDDELARGSDMLERLRTGLAGRYRVERQLAQGGMGTLFVGEAAGTGLPVAVKVLSPWVANQVTRQRFLREISIVARLTFEHIVPILESGAVEDLLYYVMPRLEGESLRDRLWREHTVPLEQALHIARDVADALSWAHAQRIVHRDIKPENVFLTNGRAVVMDFGVAVAISASIDERLTRPGEVLGTPLYMSPEQAMGRRQLDHRTDIYALGCVVYEMLTGTPPFQPPTPHAIIVRRFDQEPPRVRDVHPGLPQQVDSALRRALAWLPGDRFDTVSDFLRTLESACREEGN